MVQIPPKRGGEHPIYGVFIGGGELDENYRLSGSRHYKFPLNEEKLKL